MAGDRYLKAVLTIIALELAYIAATQTATPVTAQQQATPVVITGIELDGARNFLPVGILGEVATGAGGSRGASAGPLQVTVRDDRPIRVSVPLPLDVRTVTPVRIDTDRPIRVENVGYTGTPQPR